MTGKGKRIRRKPEEARALILDAAEAAVAVSGPAGLRLQDVARRAGVSHPTILHHFKNREGLVLALNRRTLEGLKTALIAGMQPTSENGDDGVTKSFAAYRGGLAERVVWLLQAPGAEAVPGLTVFDEIVAALHDLRRKFALPGHEPDIADTRHVVHLVTIAALGDALLGARLRQAGDAEAAARARFEKWFSDLITLFMRAKM